MGADKSAFRKLSGIESTDVTEFSHAGAKRMRRG